MSELESNPLQLSDERLKWMEYLTLLHHLRRYCGTPGVEAADLIEQLATTLERVREEARDLGFRAVIPDKGEPYITRIIDLGDGDDGPEDLDLPTLAALLAQAPEGEEGE